MATMHQEIARGPGSASAKVQALIDAACEFDRSAYELLLLIEADIARCVDEGDWDAVDSLVVHRRLHKQTREIMLQQAEAAIRHVDASVILRDLLRAA